jgi:hypothetical protein
LTTVLKLQHQYFIPALCWVFIVLISFKTLDFVIKMTRSIEKELAVAGPDNETDKSEKKAGTGFEDKKEFLDASNPASFGLLSGLSLLPVPDFAIHYISAHFYQIIAPPPDRVYIFK